MQPTTYVCGHRNPDTDSIVSAMAYASLCNAIGENNYVPVRLGHCNDETNYLLKRFGFQPPLRISTVRTQVNDIEFDRPPRLSQSLPVSHAWEILRENPNLSSLPVSNEELLQVPDYELPTELDDEEDAGAEDVDDDSPQPQQNNGGGFDFDEDFW